MKSMFRSKSFWLHVVTGASGLLAIPEVVALIPPVVVVKALPFVSLAGIIIRKYTTQPASFSGGTGDGK